MTVSDKLQGALRAPTIPVLAILVALSAAGCAHGVDPRLVEDAQTAMRVKTILINDAELGTRAIGVRVNHGVARLSGAVASDAEVARAVTLAGSVSGVVRVETDLQVRPAGRPGPPAEPSGRTPEYAPDIAPESSPGNILALGVSVSPRYSGDERLSGRWSVGPLLRIGSGNGLGITVGFSWFNADLNAIGVADTFGRLSVKPVMAGLGYTAHRGRGSFDVSMVGGFSFNSFTLDAITPGEPVPVKVDNSLAFRPAVSFWYDATRRVALNASLGYVVTRPGVTFLDNGRLDKRSLRGDTAILNFGVAYKLF